MWPCLARPSLSCRSPALVAASCATLCAASSLSPLALAPHLRCPHASPARHASPSSSTPLAPLSLLSSLSRLALQPPRRPDRRPAPTAPSTVTHPRLILPREPSCTISPHPPSGDPHLSRRSRSSRLVVRRRSLAAAHPSSASTCPSSPHRRLQLRLLRPRRPPHPHSSTISTPPSLPPRSPLTLLTPHPLLRAPPTPPSSPHLTL